jgi:hypothetical protein
MRALLTLLAGLPLCVHAQRADDNAVKSADDAFGAVANVGLGDDWTVNAGIFRSQLTCRFVSPST